MITVERQILVPAAADAFYRIITDYPGYVRYTRQINQADILDQSANEATVRFHAKFIRKFSYVLKLTGTPSRQLEWTQVDGPFKTNNGLWTLIDAQHNASRWTYRNDLDPGFYVPRVAVNVLLGPDLDHMIQSMATAAAATNRD